MIYLELFWTFFKIGAFTFGGGYAMLPLIQAEVESHGWMASADLVNFVAVSESTLCCKYFHLCGNGAGRDPRRDLCYPRRGPPVLPDHPSGGPVL